MEYLINAKVNRFETFSNIPQRTKKTPPTLFYAVLMKITEEFKYKWKNQKKPTKNPKLTHQPHNLIVVHIPVVILDYLRTRVNRKHGQFMLATKYNSN